MDMAKRREESTASRRSILQWMAMAPGAAAALWATGCGSSNAGGQNTGTDTVVDAGAPVDVPVVPDTTPVDTGSVSDTAGADANATDALAPPDVVVPTDTAPKVCEPTPPDVEGPFYAANAPYTAEIASKDEPGDRIFIRGTVYGKDCKTPVKGVIVDVWQADETGNYHDAGSTYRLRGQMTTNEKGEYAFTSIHPGQYDVGGALRPAHVHFKFHYPGQELTTQLYFEGDPYLAPNDPCGGCNSDEASLIIPLASETMGGTTYMAGTFDVNLQAS